MKWIKSRTQYLNEKIEDVILPTQKKAIISNWGANILELEEIKATEKIVQGEWKLTQEEKLEALGTFLGRDGEVIDLKAIYDKFAKLPTSFVEALKKSIEPLIQNPSSGLDEDTRKIFESFDPSNPSLNQLSKFTSSIFRKISVSESTADNIIVKDEAGVPIRDENGQIQRRVREEGEIIFEKNLVNINSFIDAYNRVFTKDRIESDLFTTREISMVISKSGEDFGRDNFKVAIDLYGQDLILRIKHNPKDILNMSISRFYASCQHLYTGIYKNQVIGNVFDPNSIPAFLIFDSPVYNQSGEKVSDQLPLSRIMVRSVDLPGEEGGIFFDRTYPDRMEDFMENLVEQKTGMVPNPRIKKYVFSPDIPADIKMEEPYMDRLSVIRQNVLGINAKSITFDDEFNWSNYKILPGANIKEVNIQTTKLPENFFELDFTPQIVRIKYIKINNLDPFKDFKSPVWEFDKCVINADVFKQFGQSQKDVKKIILTNCTTEDLTFETFSGLEELGLVYSCQLKEFTDIVAKTGFKSGGKIKKYTISGDITFEAGGNELVKKLRSQGYVITIVGPKKK